MRVELGSAGDIVDGKDKAVDETEVYRIHYRRYN